MSLMQLNSVVRSLQPSPQFMLDVKEAVAAAEAIARGLYTEPELRGVRVEEIETAQDGKQWLITLGWPESHVRQVASTSFGVSSGGVYAVPRVYKQFVLDAETGKMLSMKDRNL